MVKLSAKSPAEGLLPFEAEGLQVTEVVEPLTSVAPYASGTTGINLPAAGGMVTTKSAYTLWFGLNHYMVVGQPPKSVMGAVTDQSDAWCHVELSGPCVRDVLARLTPLDLRDAVFPVQTTARSEIKHMQASITRMYADTWRVMVFRSMAQTLVHDLKVAILTSQR